MAGERELLDRVIRIESMLYKLMLHHGMEQGIIRPPRREKASHGPGEEVGCELLTDNHLIGKE